MVKCWNLGYALQAGALPKEAEIISMPYLSLLLELTTPSGLHNPFRLQ